jgi:hypothetical protein
MRNRYRVSNGGEAGQGGKCNKVTTQVSGFREYLVIRPSLFDQIDIQMIAGFRLSSGAHLPAVPGGLVPPEREVQSEQRKSEKIKEKGAARGVAAAA